MDNSKIKIGILGAGISGLATAHWLVREGYDVTVLEKKSEAGGAMETIREDGFLADMGPNSGLETTPLIREIVNEVGLQDEMIYANPAGNNRYILRNEELHALAQSPGKMISTRLLSAKGKLAMLKEPFVGKSEEGYYQSIAQFVRRRLGNEFLDYVINPFVAGVFAGNPDDLSVKSAFPKLYRLEEEYGGLIKGTIKGHKERKKRGEESKQHARMFSFLNGMQTFPKAIAYKLPKSPVYNTEVKTVSYSKNNINVNTEIDGKNNNFEFNYLLSAIPAYSASGIFLSIDSTLSNHLDAVYYPPVLALYIGFKKSDIGRKLDGFGFLIPEKERKKFLGAIWSSVIFQNRCEEDFATFTIFVGGARQPGIFEDEQNHLYDNILSEFKTLMGINAEPVFVKEKMWNKAIPQYNLGYIEHENYFEHFENEHPGLFLSGNYRGGISVGDCVKNSKIVFEKMRKTVMNSEL